MSLYFEFRYPEDPVVAYDPPGWCIDIRIEIRYPDGSSPQGAPDAEIDAIYFEGAFQGITIWPGAWQSAIGSISARSPWTLTPRLPLGRDLIQSIEQARAGSAPLEFKTKIRTRAKSILQSGDLGSTLYTLQRSEIVTANSPSMLTIDRDRWAAILRKVGWSDIEMFEVEAGVLGEDPAFKDAMAQLRDAETAFRTRTNPAHVLVHCYKALEGMAKTKAPNSVGAGFKMLLTETFPGEPNKAELINGVVQRVKDFAHFGRHEEVPPVIVSFDEARFILASTAGVMQLIATNVRSRQH